MRSAWGFRRCTRVGVAWVCLVGVSGVSADTLRCSGGLVRDGDPAAQVLRLCGKPWHREQVAAAELRRLLGSNRKIKGRSQRWTYNFGAMKFIRYVYFIDGRVRRIETGPRGSRLTAPAEGR